MKKRAHFIFVPFLILVVFLLVSLPHLGSVRGSGLPFEDSSQSLEEMISSYHTWVNDQFNERFELLIEAIDSAPSDQPPANITPPDLSESCSNENLSTYCLGEKLASAFIVYRENLLLKKREVSEIRACDNDPLTSNLASQYVTERGLFIDQEILNASEALDVSLAAYNEFQTAYPLHTQYGEILKSLEKYRDKVYVIRRTVEKYPAKFTNVSTPNCT